MRRAAAAAVAGAFACAAPAVASSGTVSGILVTYAHHHAPQAVLTVKVAHKARKFVVTNHTSCEYQVGYGGVHIPCISIRKKLLNPYLLCRVARQMVCSSTKKPHHFRYEADVQYKKKGDNYVATAVMVTAPG